MATELASRHPLLRSLVLALVTASGTGCAASLPPNDPAVLDSSDTGGRVEPTSDAERQLLAKLGDLAPGKTERFGSLSVVAEPPYYAASGKTCRRLVVSGAPDKQSNGARLACKGVEEWFFAPDVFVAPAGAP